MTRLQTVLLLLLGVGVSAGSLVDLDKRIVGGHNCDAGERRYHVKVKAYNGRNLVGFCGGSMIHREWVLTAAHCWDNNRIMKVELGVHGMRGTEVDVTPVFYDKDPQNRPHDIMLLKLIVPYEIELVPLPKCRRRLQRHDVVQIAGHAATRPHCTGGPSNTLQCADTNVETCPWTSHEHMLCAQLAGVYGCPGDSGGGVVFNGEIYGVYTGCYQTGQPCPAGRCPIRDVNIGPGRDCTSPHTFMDVCEYLDWINSKLSPVKTAVKKACKQIRNNLMCAGGPLAAN